MKDAEAREVAERLCRIGRPLILTRWAAESCIASTRIAQDVLAYYGVATAPQAVAVIAMNAAASAEFAAGRKVAEDWPPEAWSVGTGLGFPPPGDRKGWDGHLVAVARDHGFFVDLSADQFSRPEHDMTVGPVVVDLAPPALTEKHGILGGFRTDEGAEVAYRVMTTRTYTTAADWRRRSRHRMMAGRIIRAMEGR